MSYIKQDPAIKQYIASVYNPSTAAAFSYIATNMFGVPTSGSESTFFDPTVVTTFANGKILENTLDFTFTANGSLPHNLYYVEYELCLKSSTYNDLNISASSSTFQRNSFIQSYKGSIPYCCKNRHWGIGLTQTNITDDKRYISSTYPIKCFIYDEKISKNYANSTLAKKTTLNVRFTMESGLWSGYPMEVLPTLMFELDNNSGTYLNSTSQFQIEYYTLRLVQFDENNRSLVRLFTGLE